MSRQTLVDVYQRIFNYVKSGSAVMYGVETNDNDVRLNDQDKQNGKWKYIKGYRRMVNKNSFLTEKESENIDGLNDLTTKIA